MTEEIQATEVAAGSVEPQAMVGDVLRFAREAAGLTIGDVSQALKFSPRQLEALEQHDFSALHGATFLRGFVRSYARFLKQDETLLLEMLQQETALPVAEVRPVENMDATMPEQSSSVAPHSLRTGVVLGVCLISGLALVVYAYQAGWVVLPQDMDAASTSQVAVVDEVAKPISSESSTITLPQPQIIAEPQPASEALNTVPTAHPADRKLSVSFTGDSWVEIRDARQTVVLTGKYGTGTQQTARGKPPFQVVIGNAAVVKLHYEDRLIDLQPHTRAEVARMTLDDNSK